MLPVPEIVAPLGLSFITFGIIHYFVAVYRGAKPQGLRDFFLYVSFFPTVTLGPIKLYEPFDRGPPRAAPPVRGRRRVCGLAHHRRSGQEARACGDDRAAGEAAVHAEAASARRRACLIVSIYAYGLMLYFDFAGYSDIAIGVSRLFGFTIIENFNWPYVRRNLSEFWRCWHASLTRFITQYIYIPLGGSRRGELESGRATS